jgi:hypothetical protein
VAEVEPDERSGRGALIVVTLGLGTMVLIVGMVAWALMAGSASTQSFTIEAGTGARLDAGEVIELMPTEVRLSVGDTIVIRNDDEREFMVGPYLVRPGETVTQTFRTAQVLVGECSLSGSGEIRIVVT